MTDLQIILGVIGLIFGGLSTYQYRKDQSVQTLVKSEKADREKADEVIHARIAGMKQEADALKDEKTRIELLLERTKTACLQAILDAKTETDAKIDASRSEFSGTLLKAVEKLDKRLDRFETRTMTHDDGMNHFKTIEGMVGNLAKTLEDMSSKVEAMSSALSQFNTRVVVLETSAGVAQKNTNVS